MTGAGQQWFRRICGWFRKVQQRRQRLSGQSRPRQVGRAASAPRGLCRRGVGMGEILRCAQNDDAGVILFVAQGDDGVDADGAAGWDVAGQQRYDNEKHGDGGEG
jgi:hypothetical protein